MTVVSAKTLSRDDLEFLGVNVSRQVASDRRRCRIVRYIPAKSAGNSCEHPESKHKVDSLIAAEVK